MINWRDFKTEPPYDAKEDEEAGYETDRTFAWFWYKYKNRNKGRTFLSYKACEFYDGIFTEYKPHMRTSPYPEDHIEIISWCYAADVLQLIKDNSN